MKRTYFLAAILFLLGISAQAQFRHIKGVNSIEVGSGTSKFGLIYHGSFVKYFSSKMYGKATGFYELGKDAGISFTSMGLDVAAAYTFLKVGEGVYINGLGGLTFALDNITEGARSYDISSTLKYGGLVGAEIELFLSDKIVLVLGADQRIVVGQQFGNYRAYYRGGIRINL